MGLDDHLNVVEGPTKIWQEESDDRRFCEATISQNI
jgi:hypothetical protein